MFPLLAMELRGFLRSTRSIVGLGVLQAALLLFVVSLWPDADVPLPPDQVARTVIYDFIEKLLLLLLLLTPVATAGAFALERQRATLHLLLLTRIAPWRLVAGKALAAVCYLGLLIVSSLPALALVLQVGGVPPTSLLLLYGFLLVTVIYTGLIGMYCSLRCRSTGRALALALTVIVLVNWVLPSVQLYSQMIRDYFGPGGGWEEGQYPNLFPASEFLYSTPELGWFYLVDLLSPFSVYCNFRFMQLLELQPLGAPQYGGQPAPAPAFGMVYHYFAMAGFLSLALIGACVRRLNRRALEPETVTHGMLDSLQGQLRGRTLRRALYGGFLMGMSLQATIGTIDVTPPTLSAHLLVWLAILLMGTAGADSIASERERRTLRLLALTGEGSAGLIGRALLPMIGRTGLLVGGWTLGAYAANHLPPTRGDWLEASSILRAAGAALAAATLAAGIGVLASAHVQRVATARLVVLGIMFAAWLAGMAATQPGQTIAAVSAAHLPPYMGLPLMALASFKDGALGLLAMVNPFEALHFPLRDANRPLGDWGNSFEFAPWMPLLLAPLVALVAVQVARMRLVKQEHFLE